MPADYKRIQQRIQAFDFKGLFTQELMWNHLQTRDLQVTVDGITYTLSPVAERGMAVYVCVPPNDAVFPKYPVRRKIDVQVSKTAREHIIIFHDAASTVQVWQWVKREAGKPSACREQIYYAGQSADALTQKVQGIQFSLDDEPNVIETGTRVRAAFDVEKITKKFYEQFKKEHDAFLKFMRGIPDEDLQRWYVSVMLNRLMFIYFIQKKGFLAGNNNYLARKLEESKQRGKDLFYKTFLCPLFFEGFASREEQRSPEINRLLGRVPYLNGGLFLKHQIEELHGKEIDPPDRAFERIFEFFEQYDWQLDDRPTRTGREINPDVLGYVFEKYINQKEMGAYYSKEDITGYISQNTIIPALFDIAFKSSHISAEDKHSIWRLLQQDPDRYIYPAMLHGLDKEVPSNIKEGISDVARRTDWNKIAAPAIGLPTETWRETAARRERCAEIRRKLAGGAIQNINDLITCNLDTRRFAEEVISSSESPELLRAFYKAISDISVLDPTCGSGAFLFAALNILELLYETCLSRMQAFVDDLDRSGQKHSPEKYGDFRKVLAEMNDKTRHPSPRYFILKSIILKNLYGLDIMEEATEICKLRLFLKLVAQLDVGERIEPLPDIDFNIRAGNALVGFANEEELRNSLNSRLDFEGKFTQIEEDARLAELAFRRFRQMQVEHGMDLQDFQAAKAELQGRLSSIRIQLDETLAASYGCNTRKKSLSGWVKSHQPFHWFTEFYGIMKEGGFRAIIGNPPYVEVPARNGNYQIRGLELISTGNLYSICVERFTKLLGKRARLGVIVPISAVSTPRMSGLMKLITDSYSPLFISNYAVRPGKLFVGADMNLTIIVGQKRNDGPQELFSTGYNRWATEARSFVFPCLSYVTSSYRKNSSSILKLGSPTQAEIMNKLEDYPMLAAYQTEIEGDLIYYHSGGRYFRKCLAERLSNEYKELRVQKGWGKPLIALLSSSLYYIYWISISDCYHVTRRDIETMPAPGTLLEDTQLICLSDQLIESLWENAEKRARNRADGTKQEEINFQVGKSKTIIDRIDERLAEHYKFSTDETDFIINYDSKYRTQDKE